MSLSIEDLKKLARPFDSKIICVKVQALTRAKDRAALVCYIPHIDYYARIEEVDAAWSNEIAHVEKHASTEKIDEYFTVRMRMTIKGVIRENVGESQDEKSATSDALKRVGMLFGIGRYLYDSETVWVPYDESRDKYKIFTLDEYNAALKPGQQRIPVQLNSSAPPLAQSAPLKAPAQILGRDIGKAPASKSGVIKPAPDPDATQKQSLAQEIILTGRRIGKNLPDLNEFIKENWGNSLREMSLVEMKYVQEELNRLYEGEPNVQ